MSKDRKGGSSEPTRGSTGHHSKRMAGFPAGKVAHQEATADADDTRATCPGTLL